MKLLICISTIFCLIPIVEAQELPEYCIESNGNITCKISILPYPSYTQDYEPSLAIVPSGSKIIFSNTGFNVHTATSTNVGSEQNSYYAKKEINGIFDTGKLVASQTAKPFILEDPGTYHYLCTIHDAMRGTITVIGNGEIPDWIKNVGQFWVTDQIDDAGFLQVIEFLVAEEIIFIPNAKSPQGESVLEIPNWIKTSTEYWIEESITDEEYTKGLEWMINNGIIRV